jgi:amidase
MQHADLIRLPALSVVELLAKGTVSPLDCIDALEQRIAAVDTKVNALPTLCLERARDRARALMQRPAESRGRLAGLPIPIKDLTAVEGVRTTHGSTIFATDVPARSDVLVEHLERQGAIVYAKSNTPEFGAGANTFNEVFGRTLNPWNTSRSAAGSSGGAAVALATGMAWLAHGSDMGGSLRNPASFCGVVGMRPSPGRVARSRTASLDGMLSVDGPMARDVEDLALLLDAMAGAERCDPVSLPSDGISFLAAARGGPLPRRVAFSRDLGVTPVEPDVAAAIETAAAKLAAAGVIVEEAHPDLSEAHDCFQVLRALAFATGLKDLLGTHGDKLKPEIVWNVEKGLKLTVEEIIKAEQQRVAMFDRTIAFFERYDLLLAPATITTAFPVEQRYLAECNGYRFGNYVEWLAIAYAITLVACPAVSIPAGFSHEQLPVGLQIVGPPQSEASVLRGAKLMQDVLDLGPITPIDPREPREPRR